MKAIVIQTLSGIRSVTILEDDFDEAALEVTINIAKEMGYNVSSIPCENFSETKMDVALEFAKFVESTEDNPPAYVIKSKDF